MSQDGELEPHACASELQLVENALAGLPGAMAALAILLRPVIQLQVTRILRRHRGASATGSPEVADLTQDVLLALVSQDLKILRAWVPQRGLTLERFVSLITRRRVISFLRDPKRNLSPAHHFDVSELDLQPPTSRRQDPLRNLETRQGLEQLTKKLQRRLSATGLDMFVRLFVHEQSVESIAEATGCTREAVYQWRTRIRRYAIAEEET